MISSYKKIEMVCLICLNNTKNNLNIFLVNHTMQRFTLLNTTKSLLSRHVHLQSMYSTYKLKSLNNFNKQKYSLQRHYRCKSKCINNCKKNTTETVKSSGEPVNILEVCCAVGIACSIICVYHHGIR